MFKNYIKLAWRVLGRKKFFTFISLFGISFTLAFLMLILSFLITQMGNEKPFSNKSKMVQMETIKMQQVVEDTTFTIDSVLIAGIMEYDSTPIYNDNVRSTTISSFSPRFLNNHLSNLDAAIDRTFFVGGVSFNAYVNNSKVVLDLNWTDHNYWDILDFDFLEGQAYQKDMVDNAEPVAVITTDLAMKYFGRKKDIVGEEVLMDGKNHKVIGLIKTSKSPNISANIFAPITLMPKYPGPEDTYIGGAGAYFLAENSSGKDKIIDELEYKATIIPMDMEERYNKLELVGRTFNQTYAGHMLGMYNEPKNAMKYFIIILISFLSLFILLPTLNLINLNVSRIMERSSEIGVRKAFGANKSNILYQFIFENIILTILGGLIGFVIAIGLIYFMNNSSFNDKLTLSMNIPFFLISFGIILLFGILSGLLPAYRMSKIHIVNALKENKL